MIRVIYLLNIKNSYNFLLFLDNIWRQASVNVPPVLGLNTYRILIVGIVGSKPTGGKISFAQ